MAEVEVGWWILQVQFQEKYPGQLNLLTEPMSRDVLLKKCIELIPPSSIRVNINSKKWGLADLVFMNNDELYVELTVRPPVIRVAEEKTPGVLNETLDPRIFTPVVINIPLQLIAVQKTPDILRYARTAYSFADVFSLMMLEAMKSLDMLQHYELFVEPIAKKGSFVEWFDSVDKVSKLSIHYVGPNLPSKPDSLVDQIKNNARLFRDALKSNSVDLSANDPQLTEDDVLEIDKATSERKLKLKAKGVKSLYPVKWSSKDKLEPETAYVSLEEKDLSDPIKLIKSLGRYLKDKFGNL